MPMEIVLFNGRHRLITQNTYSLFSLKHNHSLSHQLKLLSLQLFLIHRWSLIVFCQTPSSLLLQWGFLYLLIARYIQGHESGLYAGSMSDHEIFKVSGIVKLLRPAMAIMVDKGFVVDNLGKVYQPAFLSNKHQMSLEVIETQSIARLRVHVERCIWRVKENKLFDKDIPLSTCGNIDELFSVPASWLIHH